MKLTAAQVVKRMLEYAGEPLSPSAGSPDDPWRKGGFKKMSFTAKDFLGKRASSSLSPPFGPVPDLKGGQEVPEVDSPEAYKANPPVDDLNDFDAGAPGAVKRPVSNNPLALHNRFKWKPPEESAI